MDTLMVALITHVRQTVPMLVRSTSARGDALDGVLARADIARCCELLQEALGAPVKPFDQSAKLPTDVEAWLTRNGGIRKDQCLFLRRGEGQEALYAALWPWASDPTKVTLKVGRTKL